MPNTISVSVIIPCYNVDKYIGECLDSVIAQTLSNIEIICVNDGSTDETLKILNKYAALDSRIKIINQINMGIISARNNAIKLASAEYIYPLDADDKIAPTCLEKLYEIINKNIFDVVYSQIEFFGNKSGLFELPLPNKLIMYNKNCVTCSAMYKKNDWEKYGGYDENMKAGLEDWEFWLNFIEDDKKFFRINEILFFYRQIYDSRNKTINKKIQKNLIEYVKTKHIQLKQYQPIKMAGIMKQIFSLSNRQSGNVKRKILTICGIKIRISKKVVKNEKLIMTLLVKNEEDIIEQNLIFHKYQGVDGFIVTDNISTDNTQEILKKYQKLGWVLDIIYEESQDYSQSEWVNRMVLLAKNKYNADWIINSDADEFWCSNTGNLKDGLNVKTNKIFVPICNMMSENNDWINNTKKVINQFPDDVYSHLQTHNKLSKFNQFSISIPKVIVKATDYKMMHEGNHNADMTRKYAKKISNIIQIYHYNLRGLEHFKKKMLTGGAAFERNLKLKKNVGVHMRYYYEGFKNKTLDLSDEYYKSNGAYIEDEIKQYNIIEVDTTIKDFFDKGEK